MRAKEVRLEAVRSAGARRHGALALRAGACAAVVAAVLAGRVAGAAPGPADPIRRGVPSPASVSYVTKRCAGCHQVPRVGSRWAAASVSMHMRKIAIAPRDWPLIQEYFDQVGRDR